MRRPPHDDDHDYDDHPANDNDLDDHDDLDHDDDHDSPVPAADDHNHEPRSAYVLHYDRTPRLCDRHGYGQRSLLSGPD